MVEDPDHDAIVERLRQWLINGRLSVADVEQVLHDTGLAGSQPLAEQPRYVRTLIQHCAACHQVGTDLPDVNPDPPKWITANRQLDENLLTPERKAQIIERMRFGSMPPPGFSEPVNQDEFMNVLEAWSPEPTETEPPLPTSDT